jgi:hypothetical protein
MCCMRFVALDLQVDRMYEMVQDIFKSLEDGSASNLNNKLLYKHLGDTSSISNSVMLSGLRNTYVKKHCARSNDLHHNFNAAFGQDPRPGTKKGMLKCRVFFGANSTWKIGALPFSDILCKSPRSTPELSFRYEELERRLNWISDTIKYALEVAKDNKSITLERLIVLLISAELAISVLNGGILQPLIDFFLPSK